MPLPLRLHDAREQKRAVTGLHCWVRSVRASKELTFLTVYDGSTRDDVQVVYRGRLAPKPALHQAVTLDLAWRDELVADDVRYAALDDAAGGAAYPMAKKEMPVAHLRRHPDERVRTRTIQSIQRASSELAWATHDFFRQRGFEWVRTPVLTGEDCEGAGEQFSVAGAADFFGRDMSLTVSGQLDLEKQVVGGLGRGYTFGPTFRAEKSHTRRHLAEFWMVEPEAVMDTLEQLMDLAEDYVSHCHRPCAQRGGSRRFARVSYTDAVAALQDDRWPDLAWGDDLGSEQEMRLCALHGGRPTFVHHYPRALKSFYMRDTREDEPAGRETVECMDLLVPGVGELVGGSMREEDGARLRRKMADRGMALAQYASYLQTRGRVSVPHGGFGLGFERLVKWVAGADHIRDTIPYPRVAK